jgi:hypothetical protein
MDNALTDAELNRFRELKETFASQAPMTGTDDMPGVVEVWRDGQPLVMIVTPEVNRDQALEAAWFSAQAFEADRIIVVMDAHLSPIMENPTTGQPWGPGEMSKACHDDGLCGTNVITDCLIVNDVHRDGAYAMHTLTYHVDEAARQKGDAPVGVHWQPDGDDYSFSTDGDGKMTALEGLVPDALREAFKQDQLVRPTSLDDLDQLSEVEKQAAQDAAAMTRLLLDGYGVAVARQDNSEWSELVQSLLARFRELGETLMSEQEDE